MNWTHVQLIFQREIRDQLRDRRTMFTIFVLPLLLYPLMGIVMFEVAQFRRDSHVTIGLIGHQNIPSDISESLRATDSQIEWKWLSISDTIPDAKPLSSLEMLSNRGGDAGTQQKSIEAILRDNAVDAMVLIPADFPVKVWKSELRVISNQRWERSQVACALLQEKIQILHREWIRRQLSTTPLGGSFIDDPNVSVVDVSPPSQKRALIWSKILPFVLLVWALTGAFYPAIDLCAGEKERGTLETLLCSPASRREIVWGKLLTVICFSLGTALLNLASMYTTASIVVVQFSGTTTSGVLEALGPLPFISIAWLLLLVLPISVMFSALALAVASLARSTKEGQYYLMPLLLVGMPLVMLPMIPGVVLSPGTSFIPVTGAILLSRALMDGEYVTAVLCVPTVFAVTVTCSLFAVRWAVRQFESESVMFRDSGRSSLRYWLRDAWRQREDVPTANESLLCGLLILVCLFFGRISLAGQSLTWESTVQSTLIIQLGMMLGPALIMATILCRSITKAFRLGIHSWSDLIASAMLAVALHPTYSLFAAAVSTEFKLGTETTELLQQFDGMLVAAPVYGVLLVLALIPAICEELVFRGFVFSGLQRNEGHVRAILVSAFLFGLSHGVLQQSISASVMGILLGWLAYKSGGVVCTVVFHFIHNSISLLLATHGKRGDTVPEWMSWAMWSDHGHWGYSDLWCSLSLGLSILLILWIATRRRSPSRRNLHQRLKQLASFT
jgi:sodium transport system permease protein